MIGTILKLTRFATMKYESMTKACEELGISQPYLSKIENGMKVPTPELIMKMAKVYNIPIKIILKLDKMDDKHLLSKQEILKQILDYYIEQYYTESKMSNNIEKQKKKK